MNRRHFLSASAAAPALLADLKSHIDGLDIVSSHEHLASENDRLASRPDFFTLADHYLNLDMNSAGMKAPPKSWAEFEPWWVHAQNTGYARAFRIVMADLYGATEFSARAVEEINQRIADANKPGLYERVLHEKARIRYGVLDDYWNGDPVRPDSQFFVLARKLDWFCSASRPSHIRRMEEVTGVAIPDVRGLKRAMEKRLEQSLAAGLVAIKSALAYSRPLRFEVVSEAEAQAEFEDVIKEPQAAPPRRLSDHMFHHAMSLAQERKLPVQVHTGLLASNSAVLDHTRPGLLNNLFQRYPGVTFDLFHLGYPWTGEIAALAKMFPNVTVDFCWAWIISPTVARSALHELIETVPSNKLLGFGGDYRHVELAYAHSRMAREGIARVLSDKIAEGWCGEAEAARLARVILHDNTARMFPRTN